MNVSTRKRFSGSMDGRDSLDGVVCVVLTAVSVGRYPARRPT